MNALSKRDWLLLLLRQRPLDRIRLMKALFLIWHRTGRELPNYYEFNPDYSRILKTTRPPLW
ncbi:MAG: hypothetical protein Kow00128_17880 [Deltaproteobacteria bacterium]